MKRKTGLAETAARVPRAPVALQCALCARLLGHALEHHHTVPKSEGGTRTVAVHPICHRTIHAFVSNRDLATIYATMDALRNHEDIRHFIRWISNKAPDFRAPTRRRTPG